MVCSYPENRTLTVAMRWRGMFRKYQNVFRSRYKAAAWAAGVMLTAYCTVPSAGDDPAAMVKAFAPQHKVAHHADNPWALDTPEPTGTP